jgi:hypothetical protein
MTKPFHLAELLARDHPARGAGRAARRRRAR